MWTVYKAVEESQGLNVDKTYPRFESFSVAFSAVFIHGCFLVFTDV